jgi:dolichol-phosphate mannosyltransferase
VRLSVVIPCFNEERTLATCVERLLKLYNEDLSLEIIVVDDGSTDRSFALARDLAADNPHLIVVRHDKNRGKAAAVRTGFDKATGDVIAVQDADLKYDPWDLKRLVQPIRNGDADVVLGSRFLTEGTHRAPYSRPSMADRLLTFVSNMFTELNLTDVVAGHKVFRREVIQNLTIEADRFGVESELVAKIAHRRWRIAEIGISHWRPGYAEGKKIRARDAIHALYCIVRYNAPSAPMALQFLLYVGIGGIAAGINLLAFLTFLAMGAGVATGVLSAFAVAATANYFLCIKTMFRHRARWQSPLELAVYALVVATVALSDLGVTRALMASGAPAALAKSAASLAGLVLNFIGRRFVVFPEARRTPREPRGPGSLSIASFSGRAPGRCQMTEDRND